MFGFNIDSITNFHGWPNEVNWAVSILIFLTCVAIFHKWLIKVYNSCKWSWVAWEVGVPLGLPVVMLFSGQLISQAGPHPVDFTGEPLVELAPWTLMFFCLTLVAHSLRKIWPEIQENRQIFLSIISVSVVVLLYASNVVQWRLEPEWSPGLRAHSVAIFLTFASVWTCHATSSIYAHSRQADAGGAEGRAETGGATADG